MSISPIKKGIAVILALMVLVSPVWGSAVSEENGPSIYPRIDEYLTDRMDKYRIPGLALGIIRDDGSVYLKGFGRADASGNAVTPQTPFIIGSVSKPMTALAIMQLHEAGKLSLDDPVIHYIPWFRLADRSMSDAITVQQLLSHTSGIGLDAEWQVADTKKSDTLEGLVRKMADMKAVIPPGVRYQYSNANYIILGEVIQAVSGMPFGEYVKQHIFEPLEMRHSYVSVDEAKMDGLAHGHVTCFGFPVPSDVPFRADFLPAYYFISCAEDMTHFLSLFMHKGNYGNTEVLSPEGIRQMTAPGGGSPYGLGWFTGSENIYHGGSTIDFQAKVNLFFNDGMGTVLLFNTSDSTAATLFNAGYRDIIEGDMLSILFGHDEEVGRMGDPMGSGIISLILGVICLGAIVLVVFSLGGISSFSRRLGSAKPIQILMGPLLINGLIPAVILTSPRLIAGTSWRVILYHYRDVAFVFLATAIVLLCCGLIKCAMAAGLFVKRSKHVRLV